MLQIKKETAIWEYNVIMPVLSTLCICEKNQLANPGQ